jgi:hypothetical protein
MTEMLNLGSIAKEMAGSIDFASITSGLSAEIAEALGVARASSTSQVTAPEGTLVLPTADALALLVVLLVLYCLVGHTVERALELTAVDAARTMVRALELIGRFVNEYPLVAGAGVVAQVWASLGNRPDTPSR